MPAAIGIGAAVGVIVTMIGAMILTFLLAGEQVSVDAMDYGIYLILFLGAFVGAIVATACFKQRRLIVVACTAATYLLILMSGNAMFFGGEYSRVGGTLLVVAIAAAGAVFAGKGGAKSTKHRKKFRVNGKIAQ